MMAVATLLAPEYTFMIAVSSFLNARAQLKLLHRDVPSTKDSWKLSYMLFADIGGYVVLYRETTEVAPASDPVDDSEKADVAISIKESNDATTVARETINESDQSQAAEWPASELGVNSTEMESRADIGHSVSIASDGLQVEQSGCSEDKAEADTVALERQCIPLDDSTPELVPDSIRPRNSEENDRAITVQTLDHEYLRFHLNPTVLRAAIS
jgi:hypothetical protein